MQSRKASILFISSTSFHGHDNLAVHLVAVQGNAGVLHLVKGEMRAVGGDNAMFIQKSEDIVHHLLSWEITEKAGQVNAVGNILNGVKTIQRKNTAQDARVADDTAMLHGPQGVAQGLGADQLQGFRRAVDRNPSAAAFCFPGGWWR